MGTAQPGQVLFPAEIGGSVKLVIGIANPFSNQTDNCNNLTIQPTTVKFDQATRLGHSDREYSPLGILDSGTDVRIGGSRQNIDNCTKINPQGPIGTTIREANSTINCDIFYSISRILDITYRSSTWHGAA